jgi:hypothetical protein
MIHSGLAFGKYFDLHNMPAHCSGPVETIKPFFQMLFSFGQLYFIFQNSKVRVTGFPILCLLLQDPPLLSPADYFATTGHD